MLFTITLSTKFSKGANSKSLHNRLHVTAYVWSSPKSTVNSSEHTETFACLLNILLVFNKDEY